MNSIKFFSDAGDTVDIPIDFYKDIPEFDSDRISAAEQGLTKSPCGLRPDTWVPCELLASSKNNELCFRCGLRRGLPVANSTPEERKAMANLLSEKPEMPEDEYGPGRPLHNFREPAGVISPMCSFDKCPNTATHRNHTVCEAHDCVMRLREQRGKAGGELVEPVRSYKKRK